MFACLSKTIRSDVTNLVLNYAAGRFPNWLNGSNGEVGWYTPSHRGIQKLENYALPKNLKYYVVTNKMEFRYNASMKEVLVACADLQREGKTWMTPQLIDCYAELQRMGYAYSAEAWKDGQLVGGVFGIHVGSFVSVESMFHKVNNASKFAYGQLLLRLSERGFKAVDVNFVQPHLERFGAEWVPQWKFEEMLREMVDRPLSLADGMPVPALTSKLKWRLGINRKAIAVARKFRKLLRRSTPPVAAPAPTAAAKPPPAPAAPVVAATEPAAPAKPPAAAEEFRAPKPALAGAAAHD